MENSQKPAFTILDPNGSYYETGLTKREYFAAMAMQAAISKYGMPERNEDVVNPDAVYALTSGCILVADELLKALETE